MKNLIILVIILATASMTFADSAQQTSWSGGPGVTGPVTVFGNSFSSVSNFDWGGLPGVLKLTAEISKIVIDGNFDGAHSVHSIDVDGDGDWDVIAAAYNTDEIAWWDNVDGIGGVWSKHVINSSFGWALSTYGEDIDGDGDYDVIGAAYDDNEVTWWENVNGSGLTWTEHLISDSFLGASAVYSEDVDGDGDMDILGTARTSDEVTWWENADGAGQVLIEHTIATGFNGARSVHSDDIDGDGDMDVLAAAVISDRITWWENLDYTGTSWAEHNIATGFDGACAVYLDDLDCDGDMDALGAAVHADDMTWWENADGAGVVWIPHVIDNYFNGAHSIISADLDNDGDKDVIGTAENANQVTWWENADGSGTLWVEHLVESGFDGAEWAWPVDIDGDGNLDILAVAESDDDVCLWDLSEFDAAGSLESSILDTETNPLWDYFEWNSDTPSGTSLCFQVRASDDYQSMGLWSDSLLIPSLLSGYIDDGDQYVQYRVLMSTTNPDATPTLFDAMLTWDPVGIEGTAEPVPPGIALLPITPNPVTGSPVIRFGLPEPASVSLSVFDLSGRMVCEIPGNEYFPGYHDVLLGDLSPGIYFCRMISGDFMATERFVVIE